MKTRGYRTKRHSCALCKPHKMGWDPKDKPKYRAREKVETVEAEQAGFLEEAALEKLADG